MIVRTNKNWLSMLFIWNGSVLQSIIPQLLFMTAVSLLAVFTHGRIFGEKIPLNTAPFTLFGLALAIFLAFRNNASYARFNEARYLWGNLLTAARALTSQVQCYTPQETDKKRMTDLMIAFVYALKHQLRQSDPTADLAPLLGERASRRLQGKCYKPLAILNEIRHNVGEMQRKKRITDTQQWMMDAQLNQLDLVVGGCERIVSTPIPFAYGVLLHRTVYAYCVLLPFGLVDSTEFFTPLLCVFISYTLIALEAIAHQVATPFGLAPNALALDAITRTIERSVLELCDRPLPPELKPQRDYQLT